jgi:hypothetical protein
MDGYEYIEIPIGVSPHTLVESVWQAASSSVIRFVFGERISIVRFQVFTAVTMKNGVFWDVRPCGSCKNRRFGGS